MSSIGAAASHALGWTDTVVDGRTVLTVTYTLYGDANLDGTVNGGDLNTVLSNYNQTGMYWSQGDFNYDGTVNGGDLNMVLSHYNQHVRASAAPCRSRRPCCWRPRACWVCWPTPGGSGSNVVRTLRVRTCVGATVQLSPQRWAQGWGGS